MNIKHIFLTIFLFSNPTTTDAMPLRYTIPAQPNAFYSIVPIESLLSIKPSSALGDFGIITSLVVRPETDQRVLMDAMTLTHSSIVGDKHEDAQVDVVTLMRSDVSNAIGGAHIPGDNIHVAGLSLAKNNLHDGDLLVISDKGTREIKSILLKTAVPHYACWKLRARCGAIAFDFINAEGEFENGVQNNSGIIHGLHDRLRGVRLGVLLGGAVTYGDVVSICKEQSAKESLLSRYNLIERYARLREEGQVIGEQVERQETKKRELRSRRRNG